MIVGDHLLTVVISSKLWRAHCYRVSEYVILFMERVACLSPPALPLYCHSTVGLSLFGTCFALSLPVGRCFYEQGRRGSTLLLGVPVRRNARLTGLHLSTPCTSSRLLVSPPNHFSFRVLLESGGFTLLLLILPTPPGFTTFPDGASII